MRAVLLAGGKGTRLRPYTTVLPKPLVPVGDRPILELVIRQLAQYGFTRIDISVGHLGQLIKTYFEQIELPQGIELHYHWEDQPLGTAGALRRIEGLEDDFLVMNGDILTTLDYEQLMRFHRSQDVALTISTHEKDVEVSLGVIETDEGFVTDYIEKPTMHFQVSMGVYAYSAAALDLIPEGYFDFPDLVKALLAKDEKVATYRAQARWFDIGTLEEHEQAVEELAADPGLFDRG